MSRHTRKKNKKLRQQQTNPAPARPRVEPKFRVGERVRVKAGIAHPEYDDLPLGGWVGTITEIDGEWDALYCGVQWTPETLAGAHPVYRKRCLRDDEDAEEGWLNQDELEPDPGGPLTMEQPTQIITEPLGMEFVEDRIRAAFDLTADDPLPRGRPAHLAFYEYLKGHLSFPFQAWYEDPSSLHGRRHLVTVASMFDEFPIDESEGAMCQATGEGRDWELPLGRIDVTEEGPNQQLIDDYLFWFHNHEGRSDEDQAGLGDDMGEDEDLLEEDEDEDEDLLDEDEEYWDDREEFVDEYEDLPPPTPPIVSRKQVGRNDPCPCGSGKKFKKCCLGKQKAEEGQAEESGSGRGNDFFGALKRLARAPQPAPKVAATPADTAYQIKVTLLGSDPPIWRRVRLPDCTLGDLHAILQSAMGWGNEHLHAFQVGKTSYGVPSGDSWDQTQDEETTTLSRILDQGRKQFRYEYDFGDSWQHEVVIEETLPKGQSPQHPMCVDGARACPPEDSGGVWRYEARLEAFRNPRHTEHEDAVEWFGEDFDPEKFDPEKLNRWWAPEGKGES